jgi:predicted phosphate transport protein (TIGR00153 family)
MTFHPFNVFSRGENAVLTLVISNLDFSIETARHLISVVEALRQHDRTKVVEEAKNIAEMETKADGMHQTAVKTISRGSFFGGIREDVLELLEDIDSIADAAKDSSRVFSQRGVPFETIDYMFKANVGSFIRKLIEAAEELRNAVMALSEKDAKTRVVEIAAKVERKEEEADEIRAEILDNLLKNEVKADPLDIILLKQFLEVADNVADYSEDASDVLVVLIAKGYT